MPVELVFIAIGAFLGGIVTGAAGFAFAIVAGVFWVQVLSPANFVLLAAVCATLLHAASVWQFRSRIEYQTLWPFLVGALVGAPLGVLALSRVDADSFRRVIGVVIVANAGYLALSTKMGHINVPARAASCVNGAVGLVSGVLGGLTMLHGILPAIWCTASGMDKMRSRLIYQPFILFSGVYVMLMVGVSASADIPKLAIYLITCLPALLAGMWIGSRIFSRLSELVFRRVLLVLLVVSGVAMLL